jgi:hypothetical protein
VAKTTTTKYPGGNSSERDWTLKEMRKNDGWEKYRGMVLYHPLGGTE